MPDCSFPRSARLKSKRLIDSLFANGKGGFIYPLRYVVEDRAGQYGSEQEELKNGETVDETRGKPIALARLDSGYGVQVLVSVSKRYHKRAVVRNLLKRRIREAYRLNKYFLEGRSLSIALLYSSNDILEYKLIEDAVRKIIAKIAEGD